MSMLQHRDMAPIGKYCKIVKLPQMVHMPMLLDRDIAPIRKWVHMPMLLDRDIAPIRKWVHLPML